MNRKTGALAGLALLIAAAIGGAIFASSSDDGPSAVVVPTQAVVGASTDATATETPWPEALGAFPPVDWTETTPEEIEDSADGNQFLLDLETGRLYRPTKQVLTRSSGVRAFFGWTADGEVVVGMQGHEGPMDGTRSLFLGSVLQPAERLPGGAFRT